MLSHEMKGSKCLSVLGARPGFRRRYTVSGKETIPHENKHKALALVVEAHSKASQPALIPLARVADTG